MNLKLIQEDNLTGEIIAMNPKIKKVTLEYEIIKGEIGDYGLDKAKWRLGIEPYNKLLKDLYNIDYFSFDFIINLWILSIFFDCV